MDHPTVLNITAILVIFGIILCQYLYDNNKAFDIVSANNVATH